MQTEWTRQKDEQYAAEAERLGAKIPPEVLKDREVGPVCWLLSAPFIASMAVRDVKRRQVEWNELLD